MKSVMLLFLVMLSSASSFALEADFSGYLRGGTGLNLEGGQQECFSNQGIPGNFLRLGNECAFYSELVFIFNHQKPTETDPFFFRTQVRLQASSKGTRQWEPESNRDLNQIEAFVTAGGIEGIPGKPWVGKRFYRDVDLYIFDWYYYADMSGVGGGIEDIPFGSGLFSIAHLIQAKEDTDPGDTIPVETSAGRPVLQALDFRFKQYSVGPEQFLNLWGVYAWAPASKNETTSEEFQATNGYSLAARLNGALWGGRNNFTVLYGKGAMKDLNIYANSTLPAGDDSQNRAHTWRIVEDWHRDVSDNWALMIAAAAELSDKGTSTDNRREWQEIGIRPFYYLSDRIQLVFETGYSRVKDESEKNGGAAVGVRELMRVSFAPQISLSKSIWGRPVMRAFVSHSFWNKANQSFVGQGAPTFRDKRAGTSVGYQFEAWF